MDYNRQVVMRRRPTAQDRITSRSSCYYTVPANAFSERVKQDLKKAQFDISKVKSLEQEKWQRDLLNLMGERMAADVLDVPETVSATIASGSSVSSLAEQSATDNDKNDEAITSSVLPNAQSTVQPEISTIEQQHNNQVATKAQTQTVTTDSTGSGIEIVYLFDLCLFALSFKITY